MTFKVGTKVKWESQSMGSATEKHGVIVFDSLNPTCDLQPLTLAGKMFPGHKTMFDGSSWIGTRYLVEVNDSKTGRGTPKLYKPKHSLLAVDE